MSDILKIKMLGGFSIQWKDQMIDDHSNRMRKVWLLLAYTIYSRNSRITQSQLLSLLQGSGTEELEDPANRLKALFYRARTMLNGLAPNAGHGLIVRKNGTYAWNTDHPLTLDVEEFERLCSAASTASPEECTPLYLQALELYTGDFLPKLSTESWVMPISVYYHNMYLNAVQCALTGLAQAGQWEKAAQICDNALKIEPYSEALYQHLMRCRMALDDRAGAVAAYEEMSEVLFENFGVMPSDESRSLYREAGKQSSYQTVPIGTVREQLKETVDRKGAMFCEYDFFRLLYQVQARALLRSGDVVHIALLSLHGPNRETLARRSLDKAMENLRELVIGNLRQGDVVSQCSVSQLIIMLPQANFENSCAVCQRIIKAFNRQYPHSPADIHYSVQPLEPTVSQQAGES